MLRWLRSDRPQRFLLDPACPSSVCVKNSGSRRHGHEHHPTPQPLETSRPLNLPRSECEINHDSADVALGSEERVLRVEFVVIEHECSRDVVGEVLPQFGSASPNNLVARGGEFKVRVLGVAYASSHAQSEPGRK